MIRTEIEIFEIIILASESIENRVKKMRKFGLTQFYNVSFGLTRICFDSCVECLTFVLLSCTPDSDYAYLV